MRALSPKAELKLLIFIIIMTIINTILFLLEIGVYQSDCVSNSLIWRTNTDENNSTTKIPDYFSNEDDCCVYV